MHALDQSMLAEAEHPCALKKNEKKNENSMKNNEKKKIYRCDVM